MLSSIALHRKVADEQVIDLFPEGYTNSNQVSRFSKSIQHNGIAADGIGSRSKGGKK